MVSIYYHFSKIQYFQKKNFFKFLKKNYKSQIIHQKIQYVYKKIAIKFYKKLNLIKFKKHIKILKIYHQISFSKNLKNLKKFFYIWSIRVKYQQENFTNIISLKYLQQNYFKIWYTQFLNIKILYLKSYNYKKKNF